MASLIVDRAEHPDWLSNAYLVADGAGGQGVLVDGNGVVEPLLERIERDEITISFILNTHHHSDHVVDNGAYKKRFGVPLLAHELTARELRDEVDQTLSDGQVLRSGELEIRVIRTGGHAPGHLAFLVNGTDGLTGDVLFRGTVGGTCGPGATAFDDLRSSIMDLLALPPATRIHPGHREPTTVAEEWDANPFVRAWRGLDAEGSEPCRVAGQKATLVLWVPDDEGTNKAWVRFDYGEEAIVDGSRVERS